MELWAALRGTKEERVRSALDLVCAALRALTGQTVPGPGEVGDDLSVLILWAETLRTAARPIRVESTPGNCVALEVEAPAGSNLLLWLFQDDRDPVVCFHADSIATGRWAFGLDSVWTERHPNCPRPGPELDLESHLQFC